MTDLRNVVDLPAIKASGLKIGVDSMGSASVGFWQPIIEMYGLNIEVVNPRVDPAFGFMTVDKDGKIRNLHGLLVTLCHGEPDCPQGPV